MNKLMEKLLFSSFARTVYMPILALALLAGCNNDSTGSSDAFSPNASNAGELTFSTEAEKARHEEMMARLDRLHETVLDPLWGLERQYKERMISAEELYRASRGIIEKADDNDVIAGDEAIPSYVVESIAPELLNYLLQDDNTSQEGVGYFTDMLMSIESPNADMIFEALQVLDGYWTEAQIQTTANEAIRNAEQWLSHTDEGVPYAGKDRPAIVTSVQHLRSIAAL